MARSSIKGFAPFLLAGVVVGLLAVVVILSLPERPFDPLSLADDSPVPMIDLPGGTFLMGSTTGAADEQPVHEVVLQPFRIDVTEVTNSQFAAFVKATGYVTLAERTPDAKDYPGAPASKLVPGSAVFRLVQVEPNQEWGSGPPPWWVYQPGANWKHPGGPDTDLKGKGSYPVVHIAWDDAAAYAAWAGKRLPTEAEWEYAARGGLVQQDYCWGKELQGANKVYRANTFQGTFPVNDLGLDEYRGLAPVKQYPPNGYGLYDMSGNAWEWCADWYSPVAYHTQAPATGTERVRRGGSYLCADNYCRRYLPAARDKNPPDSSACHTGFRCVK
jgi:formylglycine-generating enzyme